jgi:hypothetical protein
MNPDNGHLAIVERWSPDRPSESVEIDEHLITGLLLQLHRERSSMISVGIDDWDLVLAASSGRWTASASRTSLDVFRSRVFDRSAEGDSVFREGGQDIVVPLRRITSSIDEINDVAVAFLAQRGLHGEWEAM